MLDPLFMEMHSGHLCALVIISLLYWSVFMQPSVFSGMSAYKG